MSRPRILLAALFTLASIACIVPASSLAATTVSKTCSGLTCVTAEQAAPGYLSYMSAAIVVDSCYSGQMDVVYSAEAPSSVFYRQFGRQILQHNAWYGCAASTDTMYPAKVGTVDLMVPKGAVACITVSRVNANGSRTFVKKVCTALK